MAYRVPSSHSRLVLLLADHHCWPATAFGSGMNGPIVAEYMKCNIGASILYGISCIQTFIYYKRSGGDTIVLKSLILLLWILDTIHLAFVTHAVYSYAILDFGDYLSISKPLWCITSHVTISRSVLPSDLEA